MLRASLHMAFPVAAGLLLGFASSDPALSSPQVTCQIGTGQWCLTQFIGAVDMRDQGEYREWTLRGLAFQVESPLILKESKKCSGQKNILNPRKLFEREENTKGGDKIIVVSFLVSEESNCILEFSSRSNNGKMISPQLETMLNNFRIGRDWGGEMTPLFKILTQ